MRPITVEEIERIAGGLKKLHTSAFTTAIQTLSTVHVPPPPQSVISGFPYIPPGGGGPSHGAGGIGGGGGTDPPPTETQQQLENALEAAAKEIEALAINGDPVAADLVSTSIDWAKVTTGILADNLAGGENSWKAFAQNGSDATPTPEQVNIPINFSEVDWSLVFPNGNTAPDFGTALQDLVNYVKAR